MTIETKDIVYLLTYLITLITIVLTVRSILFEIRRDMRSVKSIIFGERGALNVITHNACKTHLDDIWDKIRKTDKVSDMMLNKIEELNKNVIVIMVHMQISSPNGIKSDDKKDN